MSIERNTELALDSLAKEIKRARAKFPGNAMLLEALGEEVGELARAFTGDGHVQAEAIQVACVAIRIATEGTTMPRPSVLALARELEALAREVMKFEESNAYVVPKQLIVVENFR
ncbi:MAG: hypothetical protein FD177_1015 [Desulfovibrionaceae bacterium]|nr:MAG: hypothetical protein FD177_1015 [Desulfovibrionaceae bacterium]